MTVLVSHHPLVPRPRRRLDCEGAPREPGPARHRQVRRRRARGTPDRRGTPGHARGVPRAREAEIVAQAGDRSRRRPRDASLSTTRCASTAIASRSPSALAGKVSSRSRARSRTGSKAGSGRRSSTSRPTSSGTTRAPAPRCGVSERQPGRTRRGKEITSSLALHP